MVLLTSSSISVLVSTGVIFLFTFLLFLSGYVLQQQTVRSLQLALHPPPLPKSTLPVYFQELQEQEKDAKVTVDTKETTVVLQQLFNAETVEPTVPKEFGSPPGSKGHVSYEQGVSSGQPNEETKHHEIEVEAALAAESIRPVARGDLAYAQVLTAPSQICSALVFFQTLIEQGTSVHGRMILYPAIWEQHTASDAVSSALALMRIMGERHRITCAPISVGESMSDQVIDMALLSSLMEYSFPYDRTLFLRSPGLVANVRALDEAMQASTTGATAKHWKKLPEETTGPPSALLMSSSVLVPSDDLVIEALTSHDNQHKEEMEIEALATRAGYIHFDNAELDHRRREREWSHGGLFDRYEKSTAEVCKGVTFNERAELRRN